MIKVEIITTNYRYELSLKQFTDLEKAYQYVIDRIDQEELLGDETQVIDIRRKDDVKGVRCYLEGPEDNAVEEGKERRKPAAAQGDGLYNFNAVGFEFLGQKLDIAGLTAVHEGHSYYLPTTINGRPALDMLGHENLGKMTRDYALTEGLDEGRFTIVVPMDNLPTLEEAAAYLSDYVAEIKKAQGHKPKDKNAKAYHAWNKDE